MKPKLYNLREHNLVKSYYIVPAENKVKDRVENGTNEPRRTIASIKNVIKDKIIENATY